MPWLQELQEPVCKAPTGKGPMTRCSHTVPKTQGANQAEPQGPVLAHSGSAVLAEIGSLLSLVLPFEQQVNVQKRRSIGPVGGSL